MTDPVKLTTEQRQMVAWLRGHDDAVQPREPAHTVPRAAYNAYKLKQQVRRWAAIRRTSWFARQAGDKGAMRSYTYIDDK